VLALALEKVDRAVDQASVLQLAYGADAGGHAALDVKVDTSAAVVAGDLLAAANVRKQSIDRVEGVPHRLGVGERAEVPSPVAPRASHHAHVRPRLLHRDADVRVRFVVP